MSDPLSVARVVEYQTLAANALIQLRSHPSATLTREQAIAVAQAAEALSVEALRLDNVVGHAVLEVQRLGMDVGFGDVPAEPARISRDLSELAARIQAAGRRG